MFFTTISDESFGGSYMTFLNTLTNLGGTWPRFIIFWIADHLTCPDPATATATATATDAATAATPAPPAVGCAWVAPGTDGFYPLSFFCVAVGVLWYALFWRKVMALERVEHKNWLIAANSNEQNAEDGHPLLRAAAADS